MENLGLALACYRRYDEYGVCMQRSAYILMTLLPVLPLKMLGVNTTQIIISLPTNSESSKQIVKKKIK